MVGVSCSPYLFVPNLIGYARVVLALVGYGVASHSHMAFLGCYMGSQLLDAFDGLAARALDQSSQFGAPARVLPAAVWRAERARPPTSQVRCSTW